MSLLHSMLIKYQRGLARWGS